MRITIVGGGNIGTQFAVHCAEKGHEVVMYTSRPELFEKELYIVDDKERITHKGEITLATNDPEQSFRDADIIIITLPPAMMRSIAKTIYDYTDDRTIIGVVPGNGGGECAFSHCIERGNTFFGIERVPAIARLVKKGQTVRSACYRDELHVSSLPIAKAEQCAKIISEIFDMPCTVIPNYLNLTMTPSNPILHTTRLRSLFANWHPGVVYDRVPLFYEEWDDESSRLLIECDNEVQEICSSLRDFQLSYVKSLKVHYESPTVESMTKKISSIRAFKGIATPMTEQNGKYIPDLRSRYFTSDFSYGLMIIKQIAKFAGVVTPNIDDTIRWYRNIAIEKDEFSFEDYGITDKKSFDVFYLR